MATISKTDVWRSISEGLPMELLMAQHIAKARGSSL